MKQVIDKVRSWGKKILDEDQSTKDRPINFRIVVTILMSVIIFCLAVCVIKLISK